ncbi:MAG: YraN family protein [Acidobacteriota bacterium]
MKHRSFGRFGEWVALLWLLIRGYRLRHRNWRGPSGELDLVMSRRGELVFVEVKARSGGDFGGALGAVNRSKQAALTRTASAYLSRYRLWNEPCRFDVIAVEKNSSGLGFNVTHQPNAFSPDLGRRM